MSLSLRCVTDVKMLIKLLIDLPRFFDACVTKTIRN